MPLVVWNEDWSVGLDRLDCDHIVLMSVANHLYDALETGAGVPAVRRLLSTLADVAARHFRAEENLLAATGYAGLDAHRAEHEGLLHQIEAVRTEFETYVARGVPLDTGNLNRVWLLAWLMDHFEGADKDCRPALADPG